MSGGGNEDVDFDDFFDDPPGSARSNRSDDSRRKSRARSRSASRSPSPARSRSHSRGSRGSRSRSDSARSDRSRSRASYSDDFSDRASEHSHDRTRSPSPAESKEPIVVVSSSNSKYNSHKKKNNAGNDHSDYLSDSSVDSDVTDVSPLNSPTRKRHSSKSDQKQNFRPVHNSDEYVYSSKNSGKPPNSGKRRPTSAKSTDTYSEQDKDQSDHDAMNMKILMDVLAMEQDPRSQEQLARAKKVLFQPSGPKPQGKKNFSFSNDQVDQIDRENQRLMERIMKCAHETNSLKDGSTRKQRPRKSKPVMTPSAVNRQRQQERIERENLALLKRLQTTKATSTLRRDRLLHDYQGKLIAGQSVAAAHGGHAKPSGTYTRSQYIDTYGMSDITEPATVILSNDSSKRLTRPTSASTLRSNTSTGYRPASGKRRPRSAHVKHDGW